MTHSHSLPTHSSLAAVFLDYENLYYHLKTAYQEPPDINDTVLDILRNLRKMLVENMELDPIVFRGYADFERLATPPLGSLYLMGIDTVNVLGTHHKNAADMRLCIDLMEVLYTRPDIQHYVLVAGDRDYIPIVQHLRKQARTVTAVSFREALSGDLLEIIGKNNVREALDLLPDASREALLKHKETRLAIQKEASAHLPHLTVIDKINLDKINHGRSTLRHVPRPRVFSVDASITAHSTNGQTVHSQEDNLQICLEELILFMQEKNVREVWLSPFLRSLTDALPMLADYERKALISRLEESGALRVEKRMGDPYDYSVIIVNQEHPRVQQLTTT